MELPQNHKRKVKERLRPYVKDPHAVDLLDQLLILNPEKRINADDALMHDFFWTDPMPSELTKMLSQLTQSNFEYLAPPRRSNQMIHRYQQQAANQVQQRPQDNSYQDRVYWIHHLLFFAFVTLSRTFKSSFNFVAFFFTLLTMNKLINM